MEYRRSFNELFAHEAKFTGQHTRKLVQGYLFLFAWNSFKECLLIILYLHNWRTEQIYDIYCILINIKWSC